MCEKVNTLSPIVAHASIRIRPHILVLVLSNVIYPITLGPEPCWITDTIIIFLYVGLCKVACTGIVLYVHVLHAG